jgi:hypothetical protein
MSRLKTYCEVTIDTGEVDDEGNEIYQKDYYFLLHWGIRYDIVSDQAVSYTVGIMQNVKTGQIELHEPTSIRIIGNEIKE